MVSGGGDGSTVSDNGIGGAWLVVMVVLHG